MVDHGKPIDRYQESENPRDLANPGRPVLIRIFAIFVLLVSLFHLLQFTQLLTHWFVISSLPLTLPPAFLAAEGLIWFITGMIISGGIWKGRSWGRIAGMIASTLYSLKYWGIWIWSTPWAEVAQRWPANLFFTLIGFGLAALALNHPASRSYFRKKA